MKKHNIVIAGSGFAGVWAAAAAARAVALAGQEGRVCITVVSPAPRMVIRPRLYEAVIDNMEPDVLPLFNALGVRHMAGRVVEIRAEVRQVVVEADGSRLTLDYDRFVLAAGSQLFAPAVPGLAEHALNVDQIEGARALAAHLQALASRPDSAARNTVVVAGGGLTGIETAAEMPDRLRGVLGAGAVVRVVVVERAGGIGPDLGAAPRPVIEAALAECGVEIVPNAAVSAVDEGGVTLSTGLRIDAATVVWTAGARAHPLGAQVPGRRDEVGRVFVDAFLQAEGAADILVTGDMAHALTDGLGNAALMSCQHALSLGRVAGYNAAAGLLGLPLHPYSQPKYVTCLDLGPWGALYTEGWDRQVCLTGEEGKALKREINTRWIYPPAPDREAVFAVANPDFVIVP